MSKWLDYKDIQLLPINRCLVNSRDIVDLKTWFLNFRFQNNVIPSNMYDVISPEIIESFDNKNVQTPRYMHIMHRFGEQKGIVELIKYRKNKELLTSVSCGVQKKDLEFVEKLEKEKLRVDFLTIDVANAYSNKVTAFANYIKPYRNYAFTNLIVGNVASPEAVMGLEQLVDFDAVKIGIGGGSICTTRYQTGFYAPMFTLLQKCRKVTRKLIIADGGIEHPGDIMKAVVAGADMVMCGKLFAACADSPSERSYDKSNKIYRGSTSKDFNVGKNVEGRSIQLPADPKTVLEKMEEINQALRSAVSYAGLGSLDAVKINREHMRWIKVNR